MTNWFERARLEISKPLRLHTAITAISGLRVTNGSTPSGDFSEIEGAAEPRLSPPANLTAILAQACQGVDGIDPATFLALLSPQDIEDIEGGYIPVITLNAYAKSFAEGIRVGRIKVLAKGSSVGPDSEGVQRECRI